MSNPLISIVLPLHNAEAHLGRSLSQLRALEPSRGEYQFVIVNDHSSDRTAAIVASWPAQLSGEVILLEARDRGVSHARNQALERCSGEYVWFVDADDVWDESILVLLAATGDRDRADVVVCNATKQTPDGEPRGRIDDALVEEQSSGAEAFMRMLEGRLQGHLWNKLFRRAALPPAPFPNQRAHSDLGATLTLLSRAQLVSYQPRVLYTYLQNPGSILNSRTYDWTNLVRCLEIADTEAANYPPSPRMARALLRFRFLNVVLPIASELARRSDFTSKESVNSATTDLRSRIYVRDILSLAMSESRSAAARVALLAVSPRLYMTLYRRARLHAVTANA